MPIEPTSPTDQTPALDNFRKDYDTNDNLWWATACGHHQNLFDEACERLDATTKRADLLYEFLLEAIDLLTILRAVAGPTIAEAGLLGMLDECVADATTQVLAPAPPSE